MKFIQIFVPVVILHLVVITVLLVMPGCQARKTPPPAPAGATPMSSAVSPQESAPADFVPPAAQPPASSRPRADRLPPMRPVGSESGVDPAFNAHLPVDDGAPLRPLTRGEMSWSTHDTGTTRDYTVERGDTLSGIARKEGVSVADLRAANNLSGDTIRIGQTLRVPQGQPSTRASSSFGVPVDAAGEEVYEVRPGDTLSVIARRHGVTVAELKTNNALTSDRIVVGQELYVTPRGTATGNMTGNTSSRSAPAPAGEGATYVVAPGDNPSTIARRLGVGTQELMRANNISDPTRMRVGQVLVVPGGGQGTARPPSAGAGTQTRSIVPPVEAPRANTPLRSEPTRPLQLNPTTPAEELLDPADLDALLGDDVPVSPVEVVEPTGEGN